MSHRFDRNNDSVSFNVGFDVGASFKFSAELFSPPACRPRPPIPPRHCEPRPLPQCQLQPVEQCTPRPPAYRPGGPYMPASYEQNSGFTSWNNVKVGQDGTRTYDAGSRTWNNGKASDAYGTRTWDNGSMTWNKGADNPYSGAQSWNNGYARWSNGTDNNYYTGQHQWSTGEAGVNMGNNYGFTIGQVGWSARNDNGYKTGCLGTNGLLGLARIDWSGTDTNYVYRYTVGGTTYTWGRQLG